MNTFLLILHENLDTLSGMNEEEINNLMTAHMEWYEKLASRNQVIGGDALDDSGVTIEGKEKTKNDAPFIANGYMVGGYYLIKAKDIQEACAIAMDCPCHLWGGTTEVRAIANHAQ
ncbi:MAG: YciI family protein [Burkholderiaceae bacterium]|jgi:hypothetical protein|nr:YciI family protein [Burkholderiaceae bacterium]